MPDAELKRKRDGDAPLDYAALGRLRLLTDTNIFHEPGALLEDYATAVDRGDSLAARLGAKLTAPRLLRALDAAFEGPIVVQPPGAVSWVEIVQFAKAQPREFTLAVVNGERVCRFVLRGLYVEIGADDWRLIMSGNVDRLIPELPCDEDERIEAATLDIVLERVSDLERQAAALARQAARLKNSLETRKANLRSGRDPPSPYPAGYDLRSDLLQQFTDPVRRPPSLSITPAGGGPTYSPRTLSPAPGHSPGPCLSPGPALSPRPAALSPGPSTSPGLVPRLSPAMPHFSRLTPESACHDSDADTIRDIMVARTEQLARGQPIIPPCDRCRRLKIDCYKHLTACQGCTKKHAKCSWRSVSDDELRSREPSPMPSPSSSRNQDRTMLTMMADAAATAAREDWP